MRVGLALGWFALWTASTWLLEGRIEALLRPGAVADRALYAVVANLLVGISGSALILGRWRGRGADLRAFGFGSWGRSGAWIAAGSVLGLGFLWAQGAPSRHPVVLLNVFAQALTVSAAEIMVCWALLGATIERALAARGKAVAMAISALASSALFGAYHFAHSPPFNTLGVVVLLSAVGLATSAFFFASRDVLATVVFHNFLALFGVLRAMSASGAVASLEQLQPALLGMAAITMALLLLARAWLRRAPVTAGAASGGR